MARQVSSNSDFGTPFTRGIALLHAEMLLVVLVKLVYAVKQIVNSIYQVGGDSCIWHSSGCDKT